MAALEISPDKVGFVIVKAREIAAKVAAWDDGATTDHDVIRRWAEDRHATPATVGGAGDGGAVGDLRLDFDFGQELEDLRPVSWDEWFAAFDERGLEFHHHQDLRADGSVSYDFSLEPRRCGV